MTGPRPAPRRAAPATRAATRPQRDDGRPAETRGLPSSSRAGELAVLAHPAQGTAGRHCPARLILTRRLALTAPVDLRWSAGYVPAAPGMRTTGPPVHTTDTRVPTGEPIAAVHEPGIDVRESADDDRQATHGRSRCIAPRTSRARLRQYASKIPRGRSMPPCVAVRSKRLLHRTHSTARKPFVSPGCAVDPGVFQVPHGGSRRTIGAIV